MSADNFILITKNKGKYKAQEKFIEGGNLSFKVEADTLEEVIRKSNDYMSEEIVEYGLKIVV